MKIHEQLLISLNKIHRDADFDTNANGVMHHIVNATFILISPLKIIRCLNNSASIAMHSFDLSLVDAIEKNKFQSFKGIMEGILKKQPSNSLNPINYVNPFSGDTYLDIASRNGLTEFVVFLLDKGAEINRINETHNCGPIHFAIEGGHAVTLEDLLKQPMINPNLKARQETALHIAVRKKNLTCASLLLEKGASANIRNSEGLTALRLAAIERQQLMAELILKKSQQKPDIDVPENDGTTTREVMRQMLPDLSLPLKYFNVNINEFEQYLLENDETGFLRRIEIEALYSSNLAEELLKMTVRHNCYDAMIGILEKLERRQLNVKEAAEMATLLGRPVILRELLRVKPEIASDLILSVCQQLGIPEKRKSNMSDLLECLKLILEQENVNVRKIDDLGNTSLYYATQANCHKVMALLLGRGSYLGDTFKASYGHTKRE